MANPVSQHPKGQYSGKILSQRIDETPKTRTEFLELKVEVNQKREVSTNKLIDLQSPFYVYVRLYLSQASFEKADLAARLRVIGFTGEDLGALLPGHPRAISLAGNVIPLYHGAKDKYDWQVSTPRTGAVPDRASNPAVAARLAGKFSEYLRGAKTTPPAGASSTVPDTTTPQHDADSDWTPSDDEVPF